MVITSKPSDTRRGCDLQTRNHLIAAFATTVLVLAASAQQPAPAPKLGPTQESYARARAVLDAAIKAHTAELGLGGIKTLSVKMSGGLFHRHQSPKAAGDPIPTPFTAELIADFERNWTVWERSGSFPGGIGFSNRWIFKGSEGMNVDLVRKTQASQGNPVAFAENQKRRFPHTMLGLAHNRAATLRWLGESEADGQKRRAISFATATGGVFNLFFDATTNLLMSWEAMQSDPLLGDVVAATTLKGYVTVNGLPMPTGQTTKLGGVLTQDVDYADWRLNTPLTASTFELPAGLRAATVSPSAAPSAGPSVSAGPSIQEIGSGLYSIEGFPGYRVFFQEFRDFLMVFEAPQNDDFTQTILRMVREKIPNKPIRYTAITHHHDDHAGGLRGYWANRTVVVTTPANLPFLRAIGSSRFTIQPDSLARLAKPAPSADAVQGRAVFTDSNQTVELIDIGPSPHADEMLVFWFPKQRILFQGDLWNREGDGSTRPANDTTAHFAEWLQKSGLPVERIFGVHGPSGTPAELQQAVQMRSGTSR